VWRLIAAAAALAAAGATAAALVITEAVPDPAPTMAAGGPGAGTAAKFRLLAHQQSNRCSLMPGELMRYPPGRRLQGSCCAPMSLSRYQRQVAALRRYAGIPQIPPDPYDIPAGLAQRLTRYQEAVRLTAAQRSVYQAAMRLAPERGPCCCHCWRWDAFQGLSDYLISQRHWPAARLAALIGDLDGCGGSG